MARFSSALLLLVSLALAGCAISPPPHTPEAQFCRLHMYRLAVPLTDAAPDGPDAGQGPTLAGEIESALRERSAPAAEAQTVLALSGGSQHGAFGAGFLDGWRRSRPGQRLPEFDVVTGISTGSILATFAFIGDTDRPVMRYSIRNERELLTPVARSRPDGSMSPFELVRVVRRGAVADLAPLRNVLLGDRTRAGEISPAVMRQVALARDQHRRLYVGAVDVDSGQAVAIDLTQAAWEYVRAGAADAAEESDEQRRLRACYVDAIVASSSAPLAAMPVFIDNGMYVDGGVRFGMFADDVITGAGRAGKVNGRRTEFYVLANGHLETGADCGRADRQRCETDPPSGRPTDPRSRWSLLELAMRSEDMLANQVYRFSADRIIGERKLGNGVWFARINRAGLDGHRFSMDDPTLDTLTPRAAYSCAEWKAEDERTLHPIQFYPRYMHCMINYGQMRGREGLWDIPRAPDPVAVAAPKP